MSASQARPAVEETAEAFADSRMAFEQVVGWLAGAAAAGLTHAQLEAQLATAGRQVLRQLIQDHLDLRSLRATSATEETLTETRLDEGVDSHGVKRQRAEHGHDRGLTTVFGAVTVARMAYRTPGHANLHPGDAALNLPGERHSHGLRRLSAIEAARGSYDDTAEAIQRVTGQALGHRQLGGLVKRAAADFAGFYATRPAPTTEHGDVLVLSADGKGIVMRPDALRPATAKAAAATTGKLATRLSRGEKRNRKRMATVGAVYDITPVPRTPADVLPTTDTDNRRERTAGPVAANKWLTASVTDAAATVIAAIFDEADRRDPHHTRTWVALVDGNTHQIDRITAEAKTRGVTVTIVIDFIQSLNTSGAPPGASSTRARPPRRNGWPARQRQS